MSSNFAVLHIKKIKALPEFHAISAHLKRDNETPNADDSRKAWNKDLLGEQNSLKKNLYEKMPEKRRKNAVLGVQYLMSASKEYFEQYKDEPELWRKKAEEWAELSLEWAKTTTGDEGNILTAELHLDETTPHLHIVSLPLVDGKLNARKLYNGPAVMRKLQTDYATTMKPLGLKRGLEGSKASHTEIKHFYEALTEPIEIPTKKSKLDIGYTKRLEAFLEGKMPIMKENKKILEERKAAVENIALYAKMVLEKQYSSKTDRLTEQVGSLVSENKALSKKLEEANAKLRQEKSVFKQLREGAISTSMDLAESQNKLRISEKKIENIAEGLYLQWRDNPRFREYIIENWFEYYEGRKDYHYEEESGNIIIDHVLGYKEHIEHEKKMEQKIEKHLSEESLENISNEVTVTAPPSGFIPSEKGTRSTGMDF